MGSNYSRNDHGSEDPFYNPRIGYGVGEVPLGNGGKVPKGASPRVLQSPDQARISSLCCTSDEFGKPRNRKARK